jgi:chromosome segregation protein
VLLLSSLADRGSSLVLVGTPPGTGTSRSDSRREVGVRIRTLEITGFKSFGERIAFAFDRGISAIVGPNGCGKSNVVDSIRWVMGEQNPRHLRGKVMEDLIFSGTESKPAVGMAEVVLCFDNSEGNAPAPYTDFAEIQVARRLYRSGESEYLINRAPVRLRDVVDFFLDTGLGNRGYTIVEQGRIGDLVSTKPEDRRFIFEEAAGISKYRQRREESERKLAATEQNLLRVTDILGELRRQINSLDRQARRANRYKQLAARQRDLELVVSWEGFQVELGQLGSEERALEEARTQAVALDASVSRAESALEEERRAHLGHEQELQRSSESLYGLRNDIQSLENGIEWEKRERESLASLVDERQDEIDELERQLLEHRGSFSQTIQDLTAFEEQLGTGSEELERRERALREQSDRLAALRGSRDAVQARLVTTSAEAATLESRCEALDERRSEIELRLRANEEALETSTRQVDGIRGEEQRLEGRLRTALLEKDELGRRLADMLRAHQAASEGREERRNALGEGRERLQQLTARLETLRETELRESMRVVRTLEGLPEEVRGRVRGVLSDVIRVEDGAESALEAVLVGRLEAVLVDDGEAALALLRALRKGSAGRATALALSAGGERLESGIVPLGRPLIEFVRTDETHRVVLERLLRGVYLVDDLSEAVRRFGVSDPPAVFVTRNGEILDRSGALTGGTGAPAGAISRASEIRRCGEQLVALEAQVHDSEVGVAEATARVETLGEEIENLRNRRHTAELAVVNLERDLERVRERGKEAIETTESFYADKEKLLGQIERAGADRAEFVLRLEETRGEQSAAETSREQLQVEILSGSRELERLEKRLVQARVGLAELGARRDQLREKKLGLESQIRESLDWVTRRTEEVRRAQERMVSLSESTTEASSRLEEKIRLEETLRVRQGELREHFDGSSERVEQFATQSKTASRQREELREQIQSRELAVQEMRLRRDQLSERILERYSVDLERYEPPEEGREGDREARERELAGIQANLQALGEVNLASIEEYEEVSERHRYLEEQKSDLEVSIERLRSAIVRINRTSRQRFRETFGAVDQEFRKVFPRMFGGGRAHLSLTDAEDVLEAGIEITAQPPGKKLQNVNLLSGGEKSLTAIALLMAVFTVKPSPFFLLDEVDATLDDVNVSRFDGLLRERAADSQFLIITHNKSSIVSADKLFGVTMQEPGLTKLVTVDLVS